MSAAVPLASEVQSLLKLTAVRQLAVDALGARLVGDSALVTRLWYQLNSETADITLFHCTVRWAGRKYALAEFVSGETLEELVKRSDPASCEREIPLFCMLLDAFEGNAIAPAPKSHDFELVDYGIGRVAKSLAPKAHGAAITGPGGSWAEESYGGAPEISLTIKEFCEGLLAPKPIPAYVPVPQAEPRKITAAPAWLVTIGTAGALLAGLYGISSLLSGRAEPSKPSAPAAKIVVPEPIEAGSSPVPLPTGIVTVAGGAKPLRQSPIAYPEAARRQWITGDVELELALGSDGAVESAAVKSGDPALVPGLAGAVKSWMFRPLRAQGKAVAGTVAVKLRFDLKP
jgi:TonB family protein